MKDSKGQSITVSKLAQRVANFIDTFIGDPRVCPDTGSHYRLLIIVMSTVERCSP